MGTWIYHLRSFPNQNAFKAAISQIIFLLYLYHQTSCTYAMFEEFYLMNTIFTQYIWSKYVMPQYSIIGVIIITTLVVVTVTTAIYNQEKYSGIRYLLSWVGLRVFPFLRILLQLNVALSAFFSILNKYCFILFVITATINLTFTFLLQNYSRNKDYLMCGNLTFSLIWRIVLYLNVLINQSIYWYQNQPYYNAIISVRFVLMWCLWLVYILSGFNIYIKFVPKFLLAGVMVVIICFASCQFTDQVVYLLHLHNFYFDYAYMMMIYTPLTVITFSLFIYKMSKAFESDKKSNNIKYKLFSFKEKIDDFQNGIQTQCFVRGLILHHCKKDCLNPECYCQKQIHFDSKNNSQSEISKIGVNKSFYCKLLMKCWYQTEANHKNLFLKIQFAEFLFQELRNTFRSLISLQECETQFRFPFERLQIARLRKQIQAQNIRLNKELYNGTLDIQFIINSQRTFQNLKTLISDILKNNKSFWATVYNNKVDLTQIVKTVKPNIHIMQTINDEWKQLSNYFDIQRKWKFYYAWYSLYIKNEKLKSVILQYFTTQVEQQKIFLDSNHINKNQENESQIVFNQLSAAIHISPNQKSTIKNVSNSFTKIFGYEHSEIKESPLDVLMTQTVSKMHHTLLHQWSFQGRSATYHNYHIKKVFIKHKAGYLIGANKHIKQLITSNNELQFIAVLKTSNDQQNLMIADEQMNIEGMTDTLLKAMGLNEIGLNHSLIKNVSTSFIIPKLIKFSNYSELLNDTDKNLFQIQNDKKKKTKGSYKSVSNKDLADKEQLTQYCQFKIAKNFRQYVVDYTDHNYNALQKSEKLKIIKDIVKAFKSQQIMYKYSCKLNVIPKILKDKKYYEIYLSELVNINKSYLNPSMVKKSEKTISGLSVFEFHKYFETPEHKRIFSLQYSNNIFIKQENNKPMRKLFNIELFKQLGRVFFSVFLIISLINAFLCYFSSFSSYVTLSKQIATIQNVGLHLFSYQSNLYQINYYNQKLLPVQYQTEQFFNSTTTKIELTFSDMQNLKNSPQLKETVFNAAFNPPATYGTTYNFYINSKFDSVNLNFDEVDFVVEIFQIMELIRSEGFDKLNTAHWAVQFIEFYVTPAFQDFISTVQTNLMNHLLNIMSNSMKITVIIYVIFAVLFVFCVFIAIFKIANIISSLISIIGVFTNFNQQDIQKIYKYSNFISNMFKYLKIKDRQQRTMLPDQQDNESNQLNATYNLTFDNKIYQIDNNNNININKKIKKIEIGSMLNKIRAKTYGLLILNLVILVCGCFYCNSLIRDYNDSVYFLSNLGDQHFTYYSTLTRIQSAINKKYTNSSLYHSYFQNNYVKEINSLKNFKDNNERMTQSKKNFAFVDQYNTAYFQNACKFFLSNDTQEFKECETISASSLQFGIQSFVYYFADKATQYLTGNSSIDYSTIYQFQMGLKYVNKFLLQLTNLWLKQYQQTVDSARNTILITTIGFAIGLVVVYLVLFEILTIRNLNIQYQTFRNIYDMYMPDYLVTKEKIIKAKLVTDGILAK